jgi:hypothetical protein
MVKYLIIIFIIIIFAIAIGITIISASNEPFTTRESLLEDRKRMMNQKTLYNEENTDKNKKFYCNKTGRCEAVDCSWCGINTLDRLPTRVYGSLGECEDDVEPYRKMSRQECLRDFKRGWCSDHNGDGVCLVGNPVGPKYRQRYGWCFRNGESSVNNWIYGFNSDAVFNVVNDH